MNKVYLDNNATTPLAEIVKKTITESLEIWPNPSSSYDLGILSKTKIELARTQVAKAINCNSHDIIFTSGGTESNNQVINTAIEHYNLTRKNVGNLPLLPHVITSIIEHDSVIKPLQRLADAKKCEVTFLPIDPQNGIVTSQSVAEACKHETCLVTVMLANNETGVIQPLKRISNLVRLKAEELGTEIFIHTDAAQAVGKIPVDVLNLGVDYLTIVGHKFYGPRIGALYVRDLEEKRTPLYPVFYGAGQERGYRPGTENTPMIAGLGAAAEFVRENVPKLYEQHRCSRDYFETTLKGHP